MAVRFAVSPLWETVAALRLLASPGRSPVHHRWASWAEPRLADLTLPVVPESAVPVPATRTVAFRDEITGLESTEDGLADRLIAVHDAIIAPVWPQLEGVLQGDIERRGQRLVESGSPAVLDELHPDVLSHRNRDLQVGEARVHVGRRDLVLIPSVFVWPDARLRDGPARLALCYPAHGFGALWDRPNTTAKPALAKLLGATRANLLFELDRPSTVSELAARLSVSAAAVSQHLAVLRGAGFVVSRRQGREVVSLRTGLGLAVTQGGQPHSA
ncbi:ArsR/SmtB family transcription factor [Amycolatopsis sp. CA-230715]|uniref:ArsR/SmtB family transcription factor n=1 Tax=Amycolatopsis sp. CA-230715 TaxID=2745196 RepID=UPI001C02A758|nr:metalloregulator ArsR/SmtB family transcription factor [Amycolatopsis sp. CA-230715]QWF81725.1 hypothetical protein HUW46_05158 [Amycolatopsis sp. CA-230715]